MVEDLVDFFQLSLEARQEGLRDVLPTIDHWSLCLAIATHYHIAVAAWNLFGNLVAVAYLRIVCTVFHGFVQHLRVCIDDEWHLHLFVVVCELPLFLPSSGMT